MVRHPILLFDRGTLVLHPPPKGKAWVDYATWDDRVEKFRIQAIHYRSLVEALQAEGSNFSDEAKAFEPLELVPSMEMEPYPHQSEALTAWKQAGRKGVVVLPTAAGKTYLAQLAMQATPRSTLIVVPTLDLMHQWYAHLKAAFPDVEVGLLGGGSRDRTPILISTYDSAAIHAESLGNRYALLIFDECHHLPTDFNRVIAEYAIAPYRLGLTATPERTDGKHADLNILIGAEVYRKTAEELAGKALAEHQVVQIKVKLSQHERDRYNQLIQTRNEFLQQSKISLGSIKGWQLFVQASARSQAGRRAMLAHRGAKEIALGTDGKLRILTDLIAEHYPERILIFTADNATVYRISQEFLIPAITHQTPVKERHEILTRFREGEYKTLVASHVLNEGVDVPAASIAIILSGTGSAREYIQRLGRVLRKGKDKDKFALLYEVVAEDTSEEGTSVRRRGGKRAGGAGEEKVRQLEIVQPNNKTIYGVSDRAAKRAADSEVRYSIQNHASSHNGGNPRKRLAPKSKIKKMLPSDLLMHRQNGEEIVPKRLNIDRKSLEVATELICCFREALGCTQGELDRQLLELEGDSPDYRLKRGLAHLLKGLCEFEVVSPLEPQLLRERVFAVSAQSVPSRQQSDRVLDSLAAQLSHELEREVFPSQIRAGLYADLAENRVLTKFDAPTPEELLHRYNLSQVQGVFYRASQITLNAHRNVPGQYKLLFRYLKLFQLMAYIEGEADRGFTITIDGPTSLFSASTRYGLAIAKLIPALLHVTKWSLAATLQMRDFYTNNWKTGRFTLDSDCGLVSHYPPGKPYDSMLEEAFVDRWNSLKTEWVLEREVDLIPIPGSVMIPDFRLVHPDGRTFLLEIVGYWRPEYLQKKFSQVRQSQRDNLILAISERLNLEKAGVKMNDVPARIVWFKDKLLPKSVLEAID